MSRAFDLIAIAAVAIVLFLPKPSLQAKPALVGEKIELDRVAALEDARFAEPGNIDHAVELADAYLRLARADWALATLAQFSSSGDHRVHLLAATAHAERLEPGATVDEAARGLAACDAEGPRCSSADRVRFGVISQSMQSLVDAKIDPYKSPQQAREAVSRVLHSTKASDKAPAPAPKKK